MSSGGHRKKNFRSRQRNVPAPASDKNEPADVDSEVCQQFLVYQKALDTRHDKHERLVKLSRDVTIDSKRVIFLLQRISSDPDKEKILPEALGKLEEIQKVRWRPIAKELENEDPYQFLRAYSPGLQEYIEAISFHRFLENGSLIPPEEIERNLVFPREDPDDIPTDTDRQADETTDEKVDTESSGQISKADGSTDMESTDTSSDNISVHVPPIEYVLGIADLTGEIMRKAIHSIGAGNTELPEKFCNFLRCIHDNFLHFATTNREMKRKMTTLKQSLQKVEMACYTLKVRGSEIPKHMLVDVLQTLQSESVGEDPM